LICSCFPCSPPTLVVFFRVNLSSFIILYLSLLLIQVLCFFFDIGLSPLNHGEPTPMLVVPSPLWARPLRGHIKPKQNVRLNSRDSDLV
jgi:hypothetical protein